MLSFCSVYLDSPPHQNRDFGGNALNLLNLIQTSQPVVAMVFVSPDPIHAAFFCPFCARLLYVLFSDLKSDSRARRYECWKTEALSGFFSLQYEQCENESESAYKYPRYPILVLTTCSQS